MRLRQLLPLVAVGVLGLLSIGPAAAAGTPAPAASPAAAVSQPTALLVSATNNPLRVRGTDGKEHLEYDLIITNTFTAPVTVTSIAVTTPAGQPLLQLIGTGLDALIQPLSSAPATPFPPMIPVSSSIAVPIDIVVPSGAVPARLSHRITYTFPATAPAAAVIGSREIDGPALTVDPFQPVVIAPPLHGAGWVNANGCCDATTPHRSTRLVADGSWWVKAETFAIDWLQLKGSKLYSGDGTRNEESFAFGADVTAVADGTVVAVVDGRPEGTPNRSPTSLKLPSDYGGNNVVEQIAPGVWAMYEHLQSGIPVRVGEKVTTGQVLGKLGNTGNSTAPHLHIQVCDGPTILTCNSLPFELASFTEVGTISTNSATEIHVAGPPSAQRDALPLYATVDDFP